jgi:hypothetical protein
LVPFNGYIIVEPANWVIDRQVRICEGRYRAANRVEPYLATRECTPHY